MIVESFRRIFEKEILEYSQTSFDNAKVKNHMPLLKDTIKTPRKRIVLVRRPIVVVRPIPAKSKPIKNSKFKIMLFLFYHFT